MYRIEKYLMPKDRGYEEDMIEVSENRLELTAVSDEIIEGEIRIHMRSCREFHVFCYSNHYRMLCRNSELIGKEGVLTYRFDTTGLEAGTTEKGELCLLSEAGEYHIPFAVFIRQPLAETSLGEIRNLFHFTNLAKEYWEEAVQLFYSDDFEMLFYGHDRQFYNIYRGLSQHDGNEHNVDEFLVAVHKKRKNTYSVKEEALLLKSVADEQKECITLVCDGWGYMHAEIQAKGDFINVHTTEVNREDFRENECSIVFSVQRSRLKSGSNIGTIVIQYESGQVEVPIIVDMQTNIPVKHQEKRDTRKLMAQLMHDYIACSTSKREDKQELLKAAEKTTERINSQYGRNVFARLCQMHILIEMGRGSEAKWILSHIEKTQRLEDMEPMHYGYYLYLRNMLEQNENFTINVREELGYLYEQHPEDAFLACLYVKVQKEKLNAQQRLAVYEQQYVSGSRNPVLYREAFAVFEESLAYLSKLDDFEVSVLLFAMRYGLYTKETMTRVVELVMRRKDMSGYLFRFLRLNYAVYEDDEMLFALCTLMIRNGMCTQECFEWYERAVCKQLRITSLYEYYMMSADTSLDKLPPRAVLMYFSYYCELDERRKAHLFSMLIRHRTEIPELFHRYCDAIKEFALTSMEKGIISENLAVIYRYVLNDDEQKIPHDRIQKIAFRHLIKIRRDGIVNVVVVQDKLKNEMVYPTEKQRAYVDCYTPEYAVLLEDAQGNRYYDPKGMTDIKLMAVEKLAVYLEQQDAESVGFFMYRTHILGNPEQAGETFLPIYRKLALNDEVDAVYRREISNKLLKLYFDCEKYEDMQELLEHYDIRKAASNERAELIRYFVYLERDEKALEILFDYGFEGVAAKTLTRLIGRKLEREPGFDHRLMALVYYTFTRGKYTQEMLTYLCHYFEGTLRQMRDIWKACVSFEADASAVAERILQAYLFSHGYLAGIENVFDYYVSHRKRDSVIQQYVCDLTYRYFVKQQLPQSTVFAVLENMLCDGCEMDFESKFAYLYYMANEQDAYNDRQKILITELVNDLISEKQYVPFLAGFSEFIPWIKSYAELTYIEYRTTPGREVVLYYHKDDEDEKYDCRQLDEVCAGYYCQKFVLFFGERLQYYFMERNGNESMLTESGFLEKSDVTDDETESRFLLLNDIIMCQSLGDERTRNELIQKYERRSIMTEKLFGE